MRRTALLLTLVTVLGAALPIRSQEKTGEQGQPRLDHAGDPLPTGAKLRLGTTRLRHRQGVEGVAFSPDGSSLASCGWGESIRIWDVETSAQVQRLTSDGMSFAVAFSPDGTRLASVGEGKVRMWDLASGRMLFEKAEQTGRINAVAFTPDGQTFATAGQDETVYVWDAKSGDEVLRLHTEGGGDAHPIAFSPDGQLLASGSRAGTIRIWNLAEGTDPVVIEKAHGREATSLAFMPGGTELISSGWRLVRTEDGQYRGVSEVFLWSVSEVSKLHEFGLPNEKLENEAALALSADGTILVTSHYNQVVLWNVQKREPLRVIRRTDRKGARSQGLAISPDKRLIASKGDDHKVEVWNVETGEAVFPQADSHHGGVLSIDTSQNGELVVTGGVEGDVHVWEAAMGRHVRKLLESGGWTRSVGFMPDGERVLAAGEFHNLVTHRFEGIMRLVRVTDGAVEREWALPDRAVCTAITLDGNRVAVALGLGSRGRGGGAPEIRVWDLAEAKDMPVLHGHIGEIEDIEFDADALFLWSNSRDGTIRKWDVENGKELEKLSIDLGPEVERPFAPKSLLSSDRRRLVLGGLISSQVPESTIGQLGSVVFGEDAGGWVTTFPAHFPSVLAASPDDSLLAVSLRPRSTGVNSRIALVRMTDGMEVLSFELDDDVPRSLSFSRNGKTLYSGMDRGDVLAWDVSAALDR